MHYVRGPKKSILVTDPVEPVIAEIIREQNKNPGPPDERYGEDPEIQVNVGQSTKHQCLGKEPDKDVT